MDLRPRVFTAHADPRTLEPDHSRRKNSGEFPVKNSVNSLATGDDLFGTADDRDITGRIQEDEKFQALLESAPHAMVIVDQTGTIILVNSQSEKLFGFSHQDLLGKSIELLLPERYRGRHVQQRERFFRAPRLRPMDHNLELYGLRGDGSEFPAEVSLSPWETEKGTYVCAAIRDLSDKKQTEDQLRKLNRELESKNFELTATNRQFETFSYSVAHDLRTPLRQIEQSAKLLLEQPSSLTPAQRQCLEQIPLVALQIEELMATVLSYVRLGGTSLAREDVDLRELVEDVISSFASETHQRKVSWCVNPLSHAHCDRILVRQVFCSLLANALKFTRIREHAVIEVGETRVTGERVFFTRDNGVGFDVKYTDELSAIRRVQPEEEFEATGVGLAMVQRIIAKHGGRIWVRSEPGSGSTFFFTLGPEPAAELA